MLGQPDVETLNQRRDERVFTSKDVDPASIGEGHSYFFDDICPSLSRKSFPAVASTCGREVSSRDKDRVKFAEEQMVGQS